MHPILLHLGHLALPTFGVLAALGSITAMALSLRTAPLCRLDPDAVWNAGLFAIVSAFVLSRLLLVATNLQTFLHFPLLLLAVPSLTAGGLLLTVIATAIWLWAKGLSWLQVLDAWTPCTALAWAFLALGHFAEGSDPGMATSALFGVRMPGENLALHPTGIYAAIAASTISGALYWLLAQRSRANKASPARPSLPDGVIGGLGVAAAGLAQFLISFVRRPEVILPGEPIPLLDPLEWVSLGLIAAGVLLLCLAQRTRVDAAVQDRS